MTFIFFEMPHAIPCWCSGTCDTSSDAKCRRNHLVSFCRIGFHEDLLSQVVDFRIAIAPQLN